MITFLGILCLISAALLYFGKKYNKVINEENVEAREYNSNQQNIDYRRQKPIKRELPIPSIKPYILVIIGFIFILTGRANPISINDAGNRQVVQTIGGDLWVRFQPGLYISGPFSKVTTYPNNVTIQVGPEDKRSKDADYWTPTNTGTFSEGDQAKMGHTVKWDMPGNEKQMKDLHTDYTNIDNLATTTLMTYQRETASYSAQRMSSEEHYSGGQSQLKDYFQDQLRNGQVLLVTETKTSTQEDGTTKTYIEVNERMNSDSSFVRSTNQDIQQYGLRPSFVSIDFIEYNPQIYVKLETKIKFAADEANSKQELVAAQQQEQTAIVQGRKLIAETTAREEAKEQEAVIQARKAKLVAAENLEQAKLDAAAQLAIKRANAEGDKLKVAAGLTPLERATIDKETAIGVAKELAKIQLPNTMILGGNGSNSSMDPFTAIGLESLINISKSMNSNKKD